MKPDTIFTNSAGFHFFTVETFLVYVFGSSSMRIFDKAQDLSLKVSTVVFLYYIPINIAINDKFFFENNQQNKANNGLNVM